MKETIIYGLVDPFSGFVRYIGQSTNGVRRAKVHSYPVQLQIQRHTHKSRWLSKLKTTGGPKIVVLEVVPSVDQLSDYERFWIAQGRGLGWPLTNITDGGEGLLGYKHSVVTKKKIQLANLGKKFSAASRAKMGEAKRNPSAEARQNMRKAQLGRPAPKISKAGRERMRRSKEGVPRDTETKEKLRYAHVGKTWREDAITGRRIVTMASEMNQ